MKLIIGLGNPGEQYKKTRHNLGFAVIDTLARELEIDNWRFEKKFNALISEANIGEKIILAKPQTFMNESGLSVKSLTDYFSPEYILVIHDEMDLPLGEFKLQENRSSAGHKGVQSIIDFLKSQEFNRLRIGINVNSDIETEAFVLQKFTEEEQKILAKTVKEAVGVIKNLH